MVRCFSTYPKQGQRESMRIDGAWRLCDDGVIRPVLRAEVRSGAGTWLPIHFLVDVGADRTVFSAGVFDALCIAPESATQQLEGLGGGVSSVVIKTQIRLFRETGAAGSLDGQFAAVPD